MKIEYNGVLMEVNYEFYKGEEQTWDYAGSADDVEIESIEVGGVDIYDLLGLQTLHDIEHIILDKLQ